jgi:hypothetical protein
MFWYVCEFCGAEVSEEEFSFPFCIPCRFSLEGKTPEEDTDDEKDS